MGRRGAACVLSVLALLVTLIIPVLGGEGHGNGMWRIPAGGHVSENRQDATACPSFDVTKSPRCGHAMPGAHSRHHVKCSRCFNRH